MTREEQRTALLVHRIKNNCYEVAENLLKEHDKQIRTEVIEEYKLKLLNSKTDLVNDIHKAKIGVEFKRQAIEIAEQLKEQNKC